MCVGTVLATTPLWSAGWNAVAQATAARRFAQEERGAAAADPPETTLSTGAGSSGASTTTTTSGTSAAPAAVAPGRPLARMVIPAIGVDTYVLQGVPLDSSAWDGLLQRGPAHVAGSALPGARGNAVILGHVNIWGSVFQNLYRLGPGDTVILQTPQNTFTYVVTGAQSVQPSDGSVLLPHGGPSVLQLVTCTGLFDSLRLVVDASLEQPAAASSPVSVSAAEALVAQRETTLLRPPAPAPVVGPWRALWRALVRGHLLQAWADAGRVLHPARVRTATAPPAPTMTFSIADAWRRAGGQDWVVVDERAVGTSAGAGGAHAGPILRVLRYTVGSSSTGPAILAVQSVHFQAPTILRPGSPAPSASAQGSLPCGGDTVTWTVGPVQPMGNDGFTFEARTSTVQVRTPAGTTLTGISMPGLAMGTLPVACGDLTGDGSTSLVLWTNVPPERAGAPAGTAVSVYRLGSTQATLIGQMVGVGTTSPPLLQQPAPDTPYEIFVPQGNGPDSGWLFQDGRYARAGAGGAPAAPSSGTGSSTIPG